MALDRATVAVTETQTVTTVTTISHSIVINCQSENTSIFLPHACHVGTNDLKSAAQVVEECKKVNRALGIISRTIKYKRKSVLLSLYKTLARPHYCTPVCMVSTLRQR